MTTAVLSLADANAQADAIARRLDGGAVYVYAGEVPDVDELLTLGQHRLLARVPLARPSAPAARDGRVEFTPRLAVPIIATGQPTFFRALAASGAAVFQGTVGLRDADLIVEGPLEAGGTFQLAALSYIADRG